MGNTIYEGIYSRPFDRLRRLWFGSSVRNKNVDQCPRCRGTDRVDREDEGWCILKLHCARCDREWCT